MNTCSKFNAFNDIVSFDTLGQEAINNFYKLNVLIHTTENGIASEESKKKLLEIYSELDSAFNAVERYIDEYSHEVNYYKEQALSMNLDSLKNIYSLCQFKKDLLTCRLFYIGNIRSAIKLILERNKEMQLIK